MNIEEAVLAKNIKRRDAKTQRDFLCVFAPLRLIKIDACEKLDAELFEHLDELLVEWLVGTDCLREWYIDHLIVLNADHYITLTLLECLDST